jgi:hypothetical protein
LHVSAAPLDDDEVLELLHEASTTETTRTETRMAELMPRCWPV